MIELLATIGVIFIAIIHVWFCILEMFLWTKPLGQKIFHLDPEFAKRSAVLAANQGVYNLFLSAGLLWGLLSQDAAQAFHAKDFFLTCVFVAGVYGAISLKSRKVFFIQALPAALTLVLLWLS